MFTLALVPSIPTWMVCAEIKCIVHVALPKQPIQQSRHKARVSVQGVKSLGGHFACLCRGVDF
jgi:hypothetical protein